MAEELETHLLTLPQGQIKGVKRESIYGEPYYSFEAIPYGQPPLGELRFKAPVPVKPWTGVRDCTNYASKPIQKNIWTQTLEGAEDCLYLNVYAKSLKTAKPLPVMIYIYGGAFCMGEGTRHLYSPDYFMAKDVIFVTFNYRLCSLGFLSLKDPKLGVPGNAGLKDQVLALRWVKEHIARFNGDADNVTIFGESAGGCSTHYMTATEQTRGLFHKAIVMSGVVLNYWSETKPVDFAYRLAKQHGYQGDNIDKQVLDYLRKLEPHKLVDHNLLTNEDRRMGLLYAFGPTVEAYMGADCVIPKPPLEMMRSAWGNHLPLMLGGTSFEGLFMYARLKQNLQALSQVAEQPERLIPYDVSVRQTKAENRKLGEAFAKLYFGEKQPGADTVMEFLNYYSYKIFWHGIYRTALSRLKYSQAPTYFYRFDFDSPEFNFFRKKYCGSDITNGVAHADDLGYLFHSHVAFKLDKSSAEYKTIERMVGMWYAFAERSDPNCAEIAPLTWPTLASDGADKVLNISNDISWIDLPELEKLKIWNTLYDAKELY